MSRIIETWNEENISFFISLSATFSDAANYHHKVASKWETINKFCTLITMLSSLSAICVEVLYSGSNFARYYNFSDKIIVVLVTSFIFSINPGHASNNHDKSCNSYLELVSRINIQLNKKVENRKPVELLLGEIKYRYDIIIERTYPPEHLRLPFGVNHLGKIDPHILRELSI